MTKTKHILGFTARPVSFLTTAVYVVLFIPLLVIHTVLPPSPVADPRGLQLSEAWQDLLYLTNGFHPYNSHRNDVVHQWLLKRIDAIIGDARASTNTTTSPPDGSRPDSPPVVVFDDFNSSLSFASPTLRQPSREPLIGVYFESTNILVYIRGTEDDPSDWWKTTRRPAKGTKGGVLVNAHYDSVSTGYGATDDGVAVVSMLQLLRYFTSSPDKRPRKGLVLLFNNGEEDLLNGARLFMRHPLSNFTHTFVNLEGAGAGGRAALFRSTDSQITRFYGNAPYPFGSVLGSDGFKLNLVRSETDYAVFNPVLNMRGLDIAFIRPRSKYHTHLDDARHTSIESLWHMLSAAVKTTEALVSYDGPEFDGPDKDEMTIDSGHGEPGVWFDLFGSIFAIFDLTSLVIVSVVLLVATPLVIFVTSISLSKTGKMYLFSSTKSLLGVDEERVQLYGLRGIFRTPVILLFVAGSSVGLAYFLQAVNPFIIHSSPLSVWSMVVSGWVVLAWLLSTFAGWLRPSALHRAYGFTWIFIISWALLVVNTVYANQHDIAAGYFTVVYCVGAFVATWVSYLELFRLPRKIDYGRRMLMIRSPSTIRPGSMHSTSLMLAPSASDDILHRDAVNAVNAANASAVGRANSGSVDEYEESDEQQRAGETTSLLHARSRPTFANYTRANALNGTARSSTSSSNLLATGDMLKPSDELARSEQPWSASLPQTTWILQLFVFAPGVIVVMGQLALLFTSVINQVGQDGVSMQIVYLGVVVLTTFLLLPILPFLHRFTHHVPLFMLAVFVATAIYNFSAFPFSAQSPVKLFFLQEVDLATGNNSVSLTGVQPHVLDAIRQLPSAQGQNISCVPYPGSKCEKCLWTGLPPRVTRKGRDGDVAADMSTWVSYNVTRGNYNTTTRDFTTDSTSNNNDAHFRIAARNTRACRILFTHRPVSDWRVYGPQRHDGGTIAPGATDPRLPHTHANGIKEIRLWSRTWGGPWTVDVKMAPSPTPSQVRDSDSDTDSDNAEKAQQRFPSGNAEPDGKIMCLWSDVNDSGTVPAYDEMQRYLPLWAVVSKLGDGLVEGSYQFVL